MPFATVTDGRLHYELRGPAGGDVVVLSNSLGTTLSMWDPQVETLAARWRVLRYDTRGHGQSSVTPGPYSLHLLARDVYQLLDHVGAARAHICGISLGGLTGLQFALDHADRLGRLVVGSAAARIGTQSSWNERIALVERQGLEPIGDGVPGRWFTEGFRDRDPAAVSRIVSQLVATPPAGYAACCAAVRDADLRLELRHIRAPTLVLAGAHDPVLPTTDASWLAEHIPGGQYLELPTAHLSNVEDPIAFTSQISRFFAE